MNSLQDKTKFVLDVKRDYLVRTFERTRRKKYENYILAAIWHKLGRNDIQPVTQQPIKRNDKYAYLDLFFPQLNISVEVDENHHFTQTEKDKIRTNDVAEVLKVKEKFAAYQPKSDFLELRIAAGESLLDIDKAIDECVAIIRQKIEQGGFLAWRPEAPYQVALENKILRVSDMLSFRTILDACRCFSRESIPIRKCHFPIGNEYEVWFPKLALADGKPAYRDIINELNDDWSEIREHSEKRADNWVEEAYKKKDNMRRIVFAKSKDALGQDAYRFVGVFEENLKRCTNKESIHERVADEIDLSLWFK